MNVCFQKTVVVSFCEFVLQFEQFSVQSVEEYQPEFLKEAVQTQDFAQQ